MRPYIQYYNSSVGVVTRLEEWWLNSRTDCHLLQNVQTCSWGPSSLLLYGYWLPSCGGEEQNRHRRDADHLRPFSANVYTIMSWKGKVHPGTDHEGPVGEQRYSSTFSLISVLGMGCQRHVPSSLPLRKSNMTSLRTLSIDVSTFPSVTQHFYVPTL